MPRIASLTPMFFGDESSIGGGERYPLNQARRGAFFRPGEDPDATFAVDNVTPRRLVSGG